MMNTVEQEQLALLIAPLRRQEPVTDDLIFSRRSMKAAVILSAQVSNLEPKEFFMPLGHDKGTWSKIMDPSNEKFDLPAGDLPKFMKLAGNQIPLRWLANNCGKGLYELLDDKDRQLAAVKSENAELRKEIETLIKYGAIQRPKA
jgi:hypothetical protein